ncbi:MAG: MBL fold metallo-hydrolase [Methanoregulaceae archaeon]|nr:MBL fold metallo-hydrolase [Methanoregulaceae archaeon]
MRTGSGTCVFLAVAVLIAAALAAGCAGLTVSRSVYPAHLDPANAGPLTITFIDVGQGDATLLRIGNRTVLVDAGPPDAGPALVRKLSDAGVRNISLLVATHPHADHIGGMHDVLSHFRVEQVLDGTSPHTSGLYMDFLSDVDRRGIPYTEAARGQVFDIGDGLSLTVLGPPALKVSEDYNGNSIVLLARYDRIGILLPGDAGIAAEDELLRSGVPLSAELLKVGHHGSSDASGAAFLAAVAPEVAVIPVGAGNDYGHPHDETLDRLGRAVPLIYQTDRDGSVVIRTDGMKYSVTAGTGNTSAVTAGAEARNTAATASVTPNAYTTAMVEGTGTGNVSAGTTGPALRNTTPGPAETRTLVTTAGTTGTKAGNTTPVPGGTGIGNASAVAAGTG